jgi:hypothetical protein
VSAPTITPEPTPDEAAAIVAAIELLWPKPAAPAPARQTDSAWRFSGRWWRRDRFGAAERPWN